MRFCIESRLCSKKIWSYLNQAQLKSIQVYRSMVDSLLLFPFFFMSKSGNLNYWIKGRRDSPRLTKKLIKYKWIFVIFLTYCHMCCKMHNINIVQTRFLYIYLSISLLGKVKMTAWPILIYIQSYLKFLIDPEMKKNS